MKIYTILSVLMIICFSNCFGSTTSILWKYDLKSVSFGNSCADDIDGDNKLEIVFSTYFNDERIYALNAEDGSVLWMYYTGGCNDAAPIIYDVDMDGNKEVILHSSSVQKIFCFRGNNGSIKWTKSSYGTDSPPSIADADEDGKPEFIDGDFHGDVVCYNGEDASKIWLTNVDSESTVQTEPVIADINNDDKLEYVVGTWRNNKPNKIAAYRISDGALVWENNTPQNVIYHGPSIADIDEDGKQEVIIGTYEGILYCLNGIDGTTKWTYQFSDKLYIGAPTTIGDINGDGKYEIAFVDYNKLGILKSDGTLLWKYQMAENATSFRGVIFTDMNNDNILDVVFGTSAGEVIALNGPDGATIFNLDLSIDYGKPFDINNAPICADFNGDGFYEIFIVGGHGESDDITKNYGRAYMISTNSTTGPEWLMFRRNHKRNAFIEKNGTGFEENSEIDGISIYPNPANTSLRIKSNFTSGTIEVYNVNGLKLINSDFTENLDISLLPAGIYLCKINSGNNIETRAFAVTR